MRAIEAKMLAAIRARKPMKSGNTEVSVSAVQERVEVRLHGNEIARVYFTGGIAVTLAGWDTPTTRSRVNAVLRAFDRGFIYRKDFQPYFRDARHEREITSREWINT